MMSLNTSALKSKIVLYTAGIFISLAVHYLLALDIFDRISEYRPLLQNTTSALAILCIIFLIRSVLERLITQMGAEKQGEQYNLIRIIRLIAYILAILVVISFIFQKPYTTLAGLGLISLVLGFALQAPITSFIGWLYIIFRHPYKVGDRVQIGDQRGDVVEIGYLDTIMEECSGDYLVNDRLSGRIIRFPNSIIFSARVINYSGQFQPFIWNETAVQISYTSDLKFVESCLLEAAARDFKEQHPKHVSPKNNAAVYFRVNKFAWLEGVVSYPVLPTDTTGRRNRILGYALPLLNASPDKVGFPEGSKR